jgi:hypothetical protein
MGTNNPAQTEIPKIMWGMASGNSGVIIGIISSGYFNKNMGDMHAGNPRDNRGLFLPKIPTG